MNYNENKIESILIAKKIIFNCLNLFKSKKNEIINKFFLLKNLNYAKELLKNYYPEFSEKIISIEETLKKQEDPLETNFSCLIEKIDCIIRKEFVENEINCEKPLYVITPTGDRQEALNLSIKMMNRQTIKPSMWIIVDDGETPSIIENINCNYKVIRCEPINHVSIVRNIREAIYEVPSNNCKVIMWEDDDFYPANYLEHVSKKLNEHDFVCARNLWYYHVGLRKYYNRYLNEDATSLHSFSFTGNSLTYFSECLETINKRHMSLDLYFLNYIKHKNDINRAENKECLPIHITGTNCKRKGATKSHITEQIENNDKYKNDFDCQKLKELVGQDFYENYFQFYLNNKDK